MRRRENTSPIKPRPMTPTDVLAKDFLHSSFRGRACPAKACESGGARRPEYARLETTTEAHCERRVLPQRLQSLERIHRLFGRLSPYRFLTRECQEPRHP